VSRLQENFSPAANNVSSDLDLDYSQSYQGLD